MTRQNVFYFWASDLRKNSGEGILGTKYLKDLKSKYNKYIFININHNKKENFNSIKSKYLKPILGIFKIWYYNFLGYKTSYINYLPLWNIFLFIFLPHKTNIGPITGTVYNPNQNLYLKIRYNFFIRIFYKLSIFFLFLKWSRVIFSTNMLKYQIPKKYIGRCNFNYILKKYKFKKSKNIATKKKILFYYRKHPTKYNKKLLSTLISLSKYIQIDIIGDKFSQHNFFNFGKLTEKKYKMLLKKYSYTINGLENLYSLHLLNSLKYNLKVFCDINLKKYYSELKSKNIIFLNFSDKNLDKKILKIIKKI